MALHLVTGGAGFIGSHIVEELVQRGEYVRVLDNLSTGRLENLAGMRDRIEFVEADIRNPDSVGQAMRGVERVIHLAALVSVPQSMVAPAFTHEANVTGTLNVLQAARAGNVQRVVLASSCAVYGDNDRLPLKETEAPRPLSPYAASKLAGEIYCQTFSAAFGLPTVALRYFNVYGVRQNPNGDYAAVIPKFIERIRAGQPPIIFGDGLQTRDFVNVADVVRANLLASEHPQAIGRVFNVASGQKTSLLELVDMLNELARTSFTPTFRPERPGDIRHSVGDTDWLSNQLGFRPETTLATGLAKMLQTL
jgi:UDP-glucose 4-epimerase